jgi:hypothetical protein
MGGSIIPTDMNTSLGTNDPATPREDFQLRPEQVHYFEIFGFLKLPRLFEDERETMLAGFESIFENPDNERMETRQQIHGDQRRVTIPSFVDRDARLRWLRTDPRVLGIASSLIGSRHEYAESDGSAFYCGTAWHADIFGAPMEQYHVKLYFYLDSLSAESGALRVIPGTNHFSETYAATLRRDLEDPTETIAKYGVDGAELPAVTVETRPGDVVVGNYRTLHASYGGTDRRRMFTMSFRAPRSG